MSTPRNPLDRIELLQGTLDLIVLQTLLRGPRHGYGIAQEIQATTRDVLQVETGSLYPALHRLAKKGWISAEWTVSENRQRVREYSLTAAGRQQLSVERSRWEQLSTAMALLLGPPQESGT
jgi:PadR family transcriptional regulator, regulatory protein PadR